MDKRLKLMAIQTSFKAMIAKGWFSVCEVDRAAELMGIAISTEHKAFLGLLHCVKFADMPDEVGRELQKVLEEVFTAEAFTINVGKNLLGRPKTKHLQMAQ